MTGWTAEGDNEKYYIIPSNQLLTPTPLPTSQPIVKPFDCPGAPPTRFTSGMMGVVTSDPGVRVHVSPDVNASLVTPSDSKPTPVGGKGVLPNGSQFKVIGSEPICNQGYVWLHILSRERDTEGYIAENEGMSYSVEPTSAYVTATPQSTLPPRTATPPVVPPSPGSPSSGVTSGLVAYYPFDGDAHDASGNRNDGAVYGATLIEDRFGKPNHAYYFNGLDSHIIVPSSPSLANMKTAMSIAAWIKIDVNADYAVNYDYRHIVSKGATYGNLWADYALGLHSDGSLLWETSSSSNSPARIPMPPPISKGIWHHVTLTFNGGTIRAYLDGVLRKAAQGPYEAIRVSSEPLYIGCRYEKPFVGAFQGSIDDVLITNRVLSDSEIQTIYRSQMSRSQATALPTASPSPSSPLLAGTSGLIAHYPFDGSAEDKSGNGHHGTIHGAQWVEGERRLALEFDGRDDYVRTSGYYDFSSTNQITLVAWMKLTGHTAFDGVLSAYYCCTYRLLVSPQLHPYYNAGTHTDVQVTSFAFHIGEWYQYAMTIMGGKASIFVNGEKVFESPQGVPASLPNIGDGFVIGSGEWSGSSEALNWPMQGDVDEVRIYRRALAEAEIQALYQEMATGATYGNITLVGALDDHYDVDPGLYRLTVKLDGATIYDAAPRIEHGRPYGKQFSNFAELAIPFNVELLKTEGNELEISLDGVRRGYDWFCWDYVVIDDGHRQRRIESGSEWGYSPTGVSVVYSGESRVVRFER
jgi:hypothetical protein